MDRKLEVLAPAGSFESLKAAVMAGADAVYMGGSRFGARAYADNPEGNRLLEAVDYAHLYGVKLYLTINTLLKEQELLEELYDYLLPCYEHGLDAVIVQDMGVMQAVRKWFPNLPVHASTQMTLCGSGGAWYWRGNFLLRRLPESIRIPGWNWNALSMEHSATVIPDSACSAAFWEEEAATAGAVHSPAVWHTKRRMTERPSPEKEHRRF